MPFELYLVSLYYTMKTAPTSIFSFSETGIYPNGVKMQDQQGLKRALFFCSIV